MLRFLTPWRRPTAPHGGKGEYQYSANWSANERLDRWREILAPYKNQPRVRYLEVGVFEGRSLLWMLENILTHPTASAVAVDIPFNGSEPVLRENLKRSGRAHKVELVLGNSETELRKLKPASFDIAYIDGAHDMRSVLLDGVNAWYALKAGGILIFDDVLMEKDRFPAELRPELAVEAFLRAFGREIEILFRDYQVIVRKKNCEIPLLASNCYTFFGPYFYDWYNSELVRTPPPRAPDDKTDAPPPRVTVPLTDREREVLERALRQTKNEMPSLRGHTPEASELEHLCRRLGIAPNIVDNPAPYTLS